MSVLLYENKTIPENKKLYDNSTNRVIGYRSHRGWIFTEDFDKMSDDEIWNLIRFRREYDGLGEDFTITEYESLEDFLLEQI
jgi:hypothetical protein